MKNGLDEKDFKERDEQFGSNFRAPLLCTPWWKLFVGALDDFMLKVLMVAAVVSITFDMILAHPEERSHGKLTIKNHTFLAWVEGFAILCAVGTVATVGSCVDHKKEKQFVEKRRESDKMNVCSVLRNGVFKQIHHNELHVGDIIELK